MSDTTDFLTDLAGYLTKGECSDLLRWTSEPDVINRFNVYRNNSISACMNALKANYPITFQLLQENNFFYFARSYVEHKAPESPLLSHYGADFIGHIKTHLGEIDLSWLESVARLDWNWLRALMAEDSVRLSPLQINEYLAQGREFDSLSFRLHASVRLVRVSAEAFQVWQKTKYGEANPSNEYAHEMCCYVMWRDMDDNVRAHPLTEAEYQLFDLLRHGHSLTIATEKVLQTTPESDLSPTIAMALSNGFFKHFLARNNDADHSQ